MRYAPKWSIYTHTHTTTKIIAALAAEINQLELIWRVYENILMLLPQWLANKLCDVEVLQFIFLVFIFPERCVFQTAFCAAYIYYASVI